MSEGRSGRYHLPSTSETEFQPGSRGRVLRNKLGIANKREMDRSEYDALLRAQEHYLRLVGPKTRFTASFIRQMHKDWLGEVYIWAGQYRTVNLSKSDFTWPPAAQVPINMQVFEKGLLREHTPCKAGPIPEVARRIALIHAELLLIHPFREGNGRLTRWLADLMAIQSGLAPPRYQFAGRGSSGRFAHYIDAVRQAYLQDYDALTGFFVEALGRRFKGKA